MTKLTIGAPAGIGDWSWLWSKLVAVRDQIGRMEIAWGAPFRTIPYVRLAAPDIEADYGDFSYEMILMQEQAIGFGGYTGSQVTWKQILDTGRQRILVQPNKWLENGMRLEDWMPDLPTNFHYTLHTSPDDRRIGHAKLERAMRQHPMDVGPIVAISCASYKGARAWDTWERPAWVECIQRIMFEGFRPLMIGGQWDDLTATVACELDLPDLVGKTSIGEMIEIFRILPGYLGFSSGLNVIRTVLDKSAMALWPCNDKVDQLLLSTSWAPPEMIESNRYMATTWRPLDDVWPVILRYLRVVDSESD